ncbi:MAG: hypothetical protein PHI66_03280 [Candidatus Pacebacteria bacterium]|nr:hypothetical protein [Candidatus Paceibacterota bacterium]
MGFENPEKMPSNESEDTAKRSEVYRQMLEDQENQQKTPGAEEKLGGEFKSGNLEADKDEAEQKAGGGEGEYSVGPDGIIYLNRSKG